MVRSCGEPFIGQHLSNSLVNYTLVSDPFHTIPHAVMQLHILNRNESGVSQHKGSFSNARLGILVPQLLERLCNLCIIAVQRRMKLFVSERRLTRSAQSRQQHRSKAEGGHGMDVFSRCRHERIEQHRISRFAGQQHQLLVDQVQTHHHPPFAGPKRRAHRTLCDLKDV